MLFFKNGRELCGISYMDNSAFMFDAPKSTQESIETIEEDTEYVYPRFRALSKGFARKHGDNGSVVLDFTEGDILRSAVGMYPGVGLYPNHLHDIERWKGIITAAEWSEQSQGIPIPGIDVQTKIWKGTDGAGNVICPQDYKTAKGILDNVITRVSTGLMYAYKQSHDMSPHEFFSAMGNVVNGEEVRLIVKKITAVLELSLVVYGADEYAKKLSGLMSAYKVDAKNVLASFTNNHLDIYSGPFVQRRKREVLSHIPPQKPQKHDKYSFAHKDISSLELTIKNIRKEQDETQLLLDGITETHRAELAEIEQSHAQELHTLEMKISGLAAANKQLSQSTHEMQAELASVEHLTTYGNLYIEETRNNAIRAYRLLCESVPDVGEDEQASTIQMLSTAPVDFVQKMLTTFTSKALSVIPINRVSLRMDAERQPEYFGPESSYRRQFASHLKTRPSGKKL